MKSENSPYTYFPASAEHTYQPVLTRQLQQELNQLLSSLRKQVRNVVAVAGWLERNQQGRTLPALQLGRPEELTFALKASPQAFALFTQTLWRKSAYLQQHARADARQQALKVRVDFGNLAAWEFDMSVIFEQITPAVYVSTLLQERRMQIPQKLAG